MVAAGEGVRMGLDAGSVKALVELGGRPMAAHSLSVMEASPYVGAVVLVAPRGSVPLFEDGLVKKYGFRKVVATVEGGSTRQESVRLGLEALPPDLDPIVIHDAARPLLTPRLLETAIERGAACGACVPGVPPAGTVKRVGPDGVVGETLDRAALREAQTP
ncbi:MAG: 2-C-methyl-D-erythritol 4-phosphate cytidylyltransferase, partial [Candidatus Zixiibacteriota bacterium]